ncbi:MAG: hypothetical protein J7K82_03445 [Thermoproteales archaeon]|nr:hypothetical protein [Thermoproteales archaeon]
MVKLLCIIVNLESILNNLIIDLSELKKYVDIQNKRLYDLSHYKEVLSKIKLLNFEDKSRVNNLIISVEKEILLKAILEKHIVEVLSKAKTKGACLFLTSIFSREAIEYYLSKREIESLIDKIYDRRYGLEECHRVKAVLEENKIHVEEAVYIGVEDDIKKLGIFCLNPGEFFGGQVYESEIC